LPFAPPFNFGATQSVHIASQYTDGTGRPMGYKEIFITYGYLIDQRFDFGNYGGITGGFRTDYSSAFGSGSKPFTFPHFNGYVNLASFNFWQGINSVIPYFKLRAAYGKAGIQPGPFDRYLVLNQQPTGNQITFTNQVVSNNPDLNVEVSSEKEVGTDLSFNIGKGQWFKSVNVSATLWKRHTDNAIFPQNVPPSIGATQLLTNAIELHSNGWQVAVHVPILTSTNFSWDLSVNLGHQTSIIDKVTRGDIPLATSTANAGSSGSGSTGLLIAAGRKIGEVYGYKALTNVSQFRADGKTPFIDPATATTYEIVEGRGFCRICYNIGILKKQRPI
jgi:hypothetical protein